MSWPTLPITQMPGSSSKLSELDATAAASCRFLTFTFASKWWTWFLTVPTSMHSTEAISALLMPRCSIPRTSRCRCESGAVGSAELPLAPLAARDPARRAIRPMSPADIGVRSGFDEFQDAIGGGCQPEDQHPDRGVALGDLPGQPQCLSRRQGCGVDQHGRIAALQAPRQG